MMRGITASRLLMIPLFLGLLDSVASNAYSAFQFLHVNDYARRRKISNLCASVQDTDLTDDKISSRRNVLLTALSGTAAAVVVAVGGASTIINNNRPPLAAMKSVMSTDGATSTIIGMTTVDEAITWIDENCDRRFLHAVVASDYHFLYRGVVESSTSSSSSRKISVINETPDLLLPETYGSQDAVEFFRQLEIVMKDDAVRPSNGHLATTSANDAAAWGTTAASIWPMMAAQADDDDDDDSPAAAVHYAWFQNGGLFYPRDNDNDDAQSSLDLRKQIIVDGRDCGKDSLDDALAKEACEVMVSARSFLAVPVSMDKELKERLRNSFLV